MMTLAKRNGKQGERDHSHGLERRIRMRAGCQASCGLESLSIFC